MTPVRSDDSEVYIMIARAVYLKIASICAAQITNLRTNLQIMNTFDYLACELHDLSDIFIAKNSRNTFIFVDGFLTLPCPPIANCGQKLLIFIGGSFTLPTVQPSPNLSQHRAHPCRKIARHSDQIFKVRKLSTGRN